MRDARPLVRVLADPAAAALVEDWTSLIALARAESLAGALAWRLDGVALPAAVETLLEAARRDGEAARVQALWEAEMARRALAPLAIPLILLKGTAYVAAGLDAGRGRSIGDLDILVPREALPDAERALLAAGWEWVKEDGYDDLYYRRWMHELPPLIHRERDRMIDVHHAILPPTARPKPDMAAMIEARAPLADGLFSLSPPDMIVHAAAHLFADGDLAGGLRNLWDIDRLLREFGGRDMDFWPALRARAALHGLVPAVARAVRLAARLYATPVNWCQAPFSKVLINKGAAFGKIGDGQRSYAADALYLRRLLARDGWARPRRPLVRLGFYVRSHWLRMPPLMLARHLWVKARRRQGAGAMPSPGFQPSSSKGGL
ncbi:MAG TPA: nucleotidyltransferase family protein [Allosphingosinicella sp.]|nr:nucleotidyltransferase family protein [Allosphingosinicella sp.]